MNKNEYWMKTYGSKVIHGVDILEVRKSNDTEWSTITLYIHGDAKADIVIRSQEQAEHLHFMLGQMLER